MNLPVVEIFSSIQGEGMKSGESATFLRLAGCDVGCKWCDTKISWDIKNHKSYSVSEIIKMIKTYPSKNIVITGGEPLMHNLNEITYELKKLKYTIWLETSGAYDPSGKIDWFCLSPKKNKITKEENYAKANELKIVISNESDFEWAEENAKKVNSKCYLLLQPEWSKQKNIVPSILKFIQKKSNWKMSIQSHKYLNLK